MNCGPHLQKSEKLFLTSWPACRRLMFSRPLMQAGAVGIEALSRGAARVVFVEEDHLRCNIIKEFADRFGFRDKALVVKGQALDFLKKNEERFNIIFLDPPYASTETMAALSLIDELDALMEEGIVIVEHSSKKEPGDHAGIVIKEEI